MSAEFHTELTVRGTEEEYFSVLKVLHHYADEQKAQYSQKGDCWYLDGELGEITEDTLSQYVEDGALSVGFDGPYGVMRGTIEDDVDLFERLADAAPRCSFEGSISGWDPGARQEIDAKLENGLLYLRCAYSPFGEEDMEEEDDEASEEAWDRIYDPIRHEYHRPEKEQPEGDGVTVTICLTDAQGKAYRLELPSDSIWDPTNLHCFPRDFLEADTSEKLIALLLHAVTGEGWRKRKEEIQAWKAGLPTDGFARLELKKVHSHEEALFFDWLRSNALKDAAAMKKQAKKVCTGAEKNKQKNLAEFEKLVNAFQPGFPDCEWTGWPAFCVWRAEGELDPADEEQTFRALESDPDGVFDTVLDWRCAAADLESFAQLLCSKENPREYAVETVTIDYQNGTAEQTAVYMPGGPALKK